MMLDMPVVTPPTPAQTSSASESSYMKISDSMDSNSVKADLDKNLGLSPASPTTVSSLLNSNLIHASNPIYLTPTFIAATSLNDPASDVSATPPSSTLRRSISITTSAASILSDQEASTPHPRPAVSTLTPSALPYFLFNNTNASAIIPNHPSTNLSQGGQITATFTGAAASTKIGVSMGLFVVAMMIILKWW